MTNWQSIDDNAFIRVVKPKPKLPPAFYVFMVWNVVLGVVLLAAGRILK